VKILKLNDADAFALKDILKMVAKRGLGFYVPKLKERCLELCDKIDKAPEEPL